MVIDPVCRMSIDPATAAASLEYEGTMQYFCSLGCRDRFSLDPRAYVSEAPAGGDHCSGHHHATLPGPAALGMAALWGVGGALALLGLYFGLLTLVSGWSFTLDQFVQFWPFVVALAAGFGLQVGLFTYLRRAVHAAQSGKVMAVSGTTSGVAMVSCCAHYLVNLLPALGATGLVSLVGQY